MFNGLGFAGCSGAHFGELRDGLSPCSECMLFVTLYIICISHNESDILEFPV